MLRSIPLYVFQVNNFISRFKDEQPEEWTMYQSWINASRYRRDKVLDKFRVFTI